jgi:DNA primase
MELRVAALPDGRDPAELVASDGADAFRSLVGAAMSVAEFEVRRALEEADLNTAAGRDRALAAVVPLIASVEGQPATREELVRYVANRLDLSTADLMTQLSAPARSPTRGGAVRRGEEAPPPRGDGPATPAIDTALRAERAFLAMCVAEPALGRRYLARLTDEHLSSPVLRRVRDHIAGHLETPQAELAGDEDPALAAGVAEVTMLADEQPSSEAALRLGFLQLDLRRIERALGRARERGDFGRQRDLWGAREDVRGELDTLMGEAV